MTVLLRIFRIGWSHRGAGPMPVTRFGPRCPRCNIGPAIDDGPCHRCRLLARLTGVPPEHRGGTLVLSSDSPLFDAELERWMLGES